MPAFILRRIVQATLVLVVLACTALLPFYRVVDLLYFAVDPRLRVSTAGGH